MAEIYNEKYHAFVTGTEDDDDIKNGYLTYDEYGDEYYHIGGDHATIDGGDGNDSIRNYGDEVTIDSGDGNDSITNTGANVLFLYAAGDGNDTIDGFDETSMLLIAADTYSTQISGSDVIVTVGDGKITLKGAASLSALKIGTAEEIFNLRGTDGNDSIENVFDNMTIDGGAGNDSITNYGGNNVTIDGGAGNDSITNSGSYASIDGGEGNDTIYASGNRITINGGDGNDYLYSNGGDSVTIDGGDGNDSITNTGANVLFLYAAGDGNDVISGFKSNSTLSISGGYSSTESGSDVIVTVGDGKITLTGAASLSTCKISSDVATYDDSSAAKTTLKSTIKTADASARTTGIRISGNALDNSIVGGSGRDTLYGKAGDDTLYGGEGDDSLEGSSGNDKLYGQGGNDYLDGGFGNDTLSGGEGADLFIYYSGDGKDVITDFSEDDTLRIGYGTGKYGVRKSGNDVIVMVDDGTITLKDAASLSTLNISGNDINEGSNQSETFENYFDGVTINALGGNDSIENWGVEVSIDAGYGNDKILNGGDESALFGGAGNDTIENWASDVSIDGGTGDDSINNDYGENISIAGGMGKDTIFRRGDDVSIEGGADNDILRKYSGSNVVLNGGDGKDKIYNYEGENVSIDGGAGNDYILSAKTSSGISIDAGDGNDSISNASSQATINGGAGNDSIKNTAANVLFAYSTGEGDDLIQGFRADSTLQIGDGTDTYSKATDGNDIIVTVGDGKITLTGAASLKTVNIAGTEMQWQLNGTTATYGTASNTLVTVSGVKSLDGISLDDKVVTISAASLGTSKVTISSGYTLALGAGVAVPKTVAASYDAGTMTYTGAGKTAGYSLSNNAISYTAGTSLEFKFSGIADSATTKGFFVNTSKKTIAIGAASVNIDKTIPVKLISAPAGYKMELGSSLPKATTISANTYDAKTMTYKTAGTTGTYTLSSDGKTISYSAGTSKQFTFSGIADSATTKGFYVSTSRKTIAIGASAVNSDKTIPVKLISAPDGYKMELGSSLPKPVTISANTYDAKTMTYKTAGTTGTYTLSSDGKTISYSAGTSKQFTFSGIADSATTKGFYVSTSRKTIAIGASAVNSDKTIPVKLISAPDGYKMELGSSLSKAATEGTSTLEDGLYTAAGQTAGYTLSYDAKTIKYREALDTAFELNNVATEPTAPSNGVVTLTPENFDKSLSIVGNDAEYAFSIANGTYTGKTFTGSTNADTITNAGTNLIINAGKGDDEISNNGAGVKINAGAGNDKITNSGANVTINGDTGNDTLWGGSYADTFVYNSGDGKDIIGGFDDNDLLQITGTFTTAYDSATGTIRVCW